MWEYNNTDELYHAKYIKREWKNGRWQYYYNNDLENQRKRLKYGIKWQQDIIDSNGGFVDGNGQVYTTDWYKKAIKYSKKDLKKLNKKIAKQSKLEKKASKAAVKVANAVSDTKYKAKKKVEKILKKKK